MIARLFLAIVALALLGAAPAPDWTRHVTQTASGAFVLGNPAAKVRLVEYLSYTCPHCAHFTGEASRPLRQNYVRTGRVAVEFRHAIRDGLDLTAALLARCGAPAGFFARSEAIFASQDAMFRKIEAWQAANPAPADTDAAIRSFASASGLGGLVARLGVPPAQQARCLADPAMRAVLTAQTKEAWEVRKIDGTPTFLLGGETLGGTWATLEPQLRAKVK